jgi:hypothetical protein
MPSVSVIQGLSLLDALHWKHLRHSDTEHKDRRTIARTKMTCVIVTFGPRETEVVAIVESGGWNYQTPELATVSSSHPMPLVLDCSFLRTKPANESTPPSESNL